MKNKVIFKYICTYKPDQGVAILEDVAPSRQEKTFELKRFTYTGTDKPTIAQEIAFYKELMQYSQERIEILQEISPNPQKERIFKEDGENFFND